jgi:hypothetical protein
MEKRRHRSSRCSAGGEPPLPTASLHTCRGENQRMTKSIKEGGGGGLRSKSKRNNHGISRVRERYGNMRWYKVLTGGPYPDHAAVGQGTNSTKGHMPPTPNRPAAQR